MITVPLKTVSALNSRESWQARARRVHKERETVGWMLKTVHQRPPIPCKVLLTRVAPSNGIDPGDNLPSALKGVRDQVADWLGVDDRHAEQVLYRYAQRRGPWAVEIEFNKETP